LLGNNRAFRHLPPTAVTVRGRDLWGGVRASLHQEGARDQFRSALVERTGSASCHLVSSGRAALALVLMSLKRLSERKRVVVPAYGCPTVVQSVLKAGLEPVLCDVCPTTLDLDRTALSRVIDGDILAVIPTHLYGWAQDVRDITAASRAYGFFVIEDAAQAFGATVGGRMVGNWGDAGFYSLGRGKCVPTGHGGVIVSEERVAPVISEVIDEAVCGTAAPNITDLALFLGYGVMTRPTGWWFVQRTSLNPADAGMDTKSLPPIHFAALSAAQAGIGSSILARVDQVQMIGRRNARRLMSQLTEYDFVTVPQIASDSEPVFLRLPVVVENEALANRLYDLLLQEGIGVSRSYWRTVPGLFPDLFSVNGRHFPGATRLAQCLLTLPTHAYLQERDFDRIAGAFETVDRRNDTLHVANKEINDDACAAAR
jgi:perosamine synthetase